MFAYCLDIAIEQLRKLLSAKPHGFFLKAHFQPYLAVRLI